MTNPIQVFDGDGLSPDEKAVQDALAQAKASRAKLDEDFGLPQINIQIQSTQITAKRRKLKMRYSPP